LRALLGILAVEMGFGSGGASVAGNAAASATAMIDRGGTPRTLYMPTVTTS